MLLLGNWLISAWVYCFNDCLSLAVYWEFFLLQQGELFVDLVRLLLIGRRFGMLSTLKHLADLRSEAFTLHLLLVRCRTIQFLDRPEGTLAGDDAKPVTRHLSILDALLRLVSHGTA